MGWYIFAMYLNLTASIKEVTVHHCEETLLTDMLLKVLPFNFNCGTVVRTGHRVIPAFWPVVGFNIFKGGLIFLAVFTTKWPLSTVFILMLSDQTTQGMFTAIMSTL